MRTRERAQAPEVKLRIPHRPPGPTINLSFLRRSRLIPSDLHPSIANPELSAALASIYTESGRTLLDLAEQSPILLVFLRHFGCSFCRQALSQVAAIRPQLESRGVRPVFVHLASPERAQPYFAYYQLGDVERISDPRALIYGHAAFALPRMHWLRHFAQPVVWSAWLRGALLRYGIGPLREDAHQMPGVFFLKDLAIVRTYRFRTIADRPDYLKLTA